MKSMLLLLFLITLISDATVAKIGAHVFKILRSGTRKRKKNI